MSHETTVEAAVAVTSAAAASKAVTWSGASVGAFGAISQSGLIGWIGVLIALAGLLMNWYYRHKEYKLKVREAETCK